MLNDSHLQRASVTRSWPRTLGYGLLAVASLAGVVSLWLNDHAVWACLLAVFGLCAAFLSATSGTARCLNCGWKFGGAFHMGSLNQCPECLTWHRIDRGNLVLVPPDFIADTPDFTLDVEILKSPAEWRLPWSGLCCVCHKPATSVTELEMRTLVSQHVTYNRVSIVRFKFGHCTPHNRGAEISGSQIKFRSHAYWTDFYSTNRRDD